ncbi:MAG: hypothetical protein A2Y12_10205 [Planctomycetes bacterium GWF2_42_9]|nr:MAG: hypothetical protein A2Y12_10205 [Planctomycetes bacterium GWF2_42_9]
MKNEEIQISKIYAIKIGKNIIGVRIMSQSADGSWVGSNIKTNKQMIIKSADRFRGLFHKDKPETKTPTVTIADQPKTKKTGGLSAAFMVLSDAGQPLDCQEIVKQMLDKGIWKTGGKTPAFTLHAAISREIKVKGPESRFVKTERGKFTVIK